MVEQILDIAIIGGGIAGVVLSLGLLKRGIKVKIYEQAHNFREIGAGVAFSVNAQSSMELLDPKILEAMKRVGNKNPAAYNRYVDGYSDVTMPMDSTFEKVLFHTAVADMAFWVVIGHTFSTSW